MVCTGGNTLANSTGHTVHNYSNIFHIILLPPSDVCCCCWCTLNYSNLLTIHGKGKIISHTMFTFFSDMNTCFCRTKRLHIYEIETKRTSVPFLWFCYFLFCSSDNNFKIYVTPIMKWMEINNSCTI